MAIYISLSLYPNTERKENHEEKNNYMLVGGSNDDFGFGRMQRTVQLGCSLRKLSRAQRLSGPEFHLSGGAG